MKAQRNPQQFLVGMDKSPAQWFSEMRKTIKAAQDENERIRLLNIQQTAFNQIKQSFTH